MIYASNLSVQEEIAVVRHRCKFLILIMPFTPLFIHLHHELFIISKIISTSIKMSLNRAKTTEPI